MELHHRTQMSRAFAIRRDVARPALSHAGQRLRHSTNEAGQTAPIQSMEEAHDWERVFIGEVKAGRDPSYVQTQSARACDKQITTVLAFLDAYFVRCVKPAGLRSIGSVRSQIAILKDHLGELPLSGLCEGCSEYLTVRGAYEQHRHERRPRKSSHKSGRRFQPHVCACHNTLPCFSFNC
jgi:hypothetical protein